MHGRDNAPIVDHDPGSVLDTIPRLTYTSLNSQFFIPADHQQTIFW